MAEDKISNEEIENLLTLLGTLFNLRDKRKYTGDKSLDAELQLVADKVRFWLTVNANSYYKIGKE